MTRILPIRLNSPRVLRGLSPSQTALPPGQSLTEVLVASSVLAITLMAVTRGIINAQGITQRSSQRHAAEALIANDLETTVRQRFFSFRCSQGPCLPKETESQVLLKNQDKPLRYYNDDNKQAFINSCQNRQLAKDLLATPTDGIASGESTLSGTGHLLKGVVVKRRINLVENNANSAVVEYEALHNNKRIAYRKAILIPNAVHWCG